MTDLSIYPYAEGVRVRALHVITEDGNPDTADPNMPFLNAAYVDPGTLRCSEVANAPERIPGVCQSNGTYIHAKNQGMGTVVGVDDDTPTVRFDSTGTATIVVRKEIEFVSESADYKVGSRVRCGWSLIPLGEDKEAVRGDEGTVMGVQSKTLTVAFDKVATLLEVVDRSVTTPKNTVLIIETS